jgi:hypothetical protein
LDTPHRYDGAMNTRSTTVLLAVLVGCGDGGGGSKGSLGSQEQALYKIDTFTENTSSCDAEGASVLKDSGDHVIVFVTSDLFGQAVIAHLCADPASCRSDRQNRLDGKGWLSVLDLEFREANGQSLAGSYITTGFSMGTNCRAAEVTSSKLGRPADGKLTLEARSVIVDHPPDGQGFCTTDDTRKAAAGKPCNRLRVITASRLEAL